MNSKWNQFRQNIMMENKPDTEKLITIATLIRKTHNLIVHREHILLFSKQDCRLVKMADSITKKEYHNYIIHTPDLIFYINNTLWIIEIDGSIHDHKNRVIEKDKMRNEHYTISGLNYIIINELLVLYDIGIHKVRSATVEELWPVINNKIKKLYKKYQIH